MGWPGDPPSCGEVPPKQKITTDSDQVVDIQRLEDEISAEKQPTQQMDVSENSGFSPQIIHFNRVFHYKPYILGYPYIWLETPKSTNKSSPKRLALFLVHGSSSLPVVCPTKNVSQGSPNQTLASLRSATLLDAWITWFGGLLRVATPHVLGPCWTFPLGSPVDEG